MTNRNAKSGAGASRQLLIGLVVVLFSMLLVEPIPSVSGIYNLFTESAIIIKNRSGANVRFEQVTIDGQVVWTRRDLIIETVPDFRKPRDTSRSSIMLRFVAPKRTVEVKLSVVTLTHQRETVSCALDNRSRPCIFGAYYVKGRLHCGECEDYLD